MKIILNNPTRKPNLSANSLILGKYQAFISKGDLYIVIKGHYIWCPKTNAVWDFDNYEAKYFIIDRFCDIKIEEMEL